VWDPNTLLSMFFWNTLILCFSLKMRDHTLITTLSLIFRTVGCEWDEQTLGTEAKNG
jgi:hypothetical protein